LNKKSMNARKNTAFVIGVVGILSAISISLADGIPECELIALPKKWEIPKDDQFGKVLLAWEVSNPGDEFIRFRTRDLGRITLVGSNGEVIRPHILGVDASKRFQESDYPLIGPHQTLYFPFAVSFYREEHGLFSLKIRSDSQGDEGWIFNNLAAGKYSLIATYSTQNKYVNDHGFMWDRELKFLKERFMANFWMGEVVSKPIHIEISAGS